MLRETSLESWERELRLAQAQHCGTGNTVERLAGYGLALLTEREALLDDLSVVTALHGKNHT